MVWLCFGEKWAVDQLGRENHQPQRPRRVPKELICKVLLRALRRNAFQMKPLLKNADTCHLLANESSWKDALANSSNFDFADSHGVGWDCR